MHDFPQHPVAARRAAFFALLLAIFATAPAIAQPLFPDRGSLKIRAGQDTRSDVLFLVEDGLIYQGDRKSEDAILFNFRGNLVRPERERTGDYRLRIRRNRVVDADDNLLLTVSNGKLYGPDDRRQVLFSVGGSRFYRGEDRRAPALYSWSGKEWDRQQAALIFAVLIELKLLPTGPAPAPTSSVDPSADAA